MGKIKHKKRLPKGGSQKTLNESDDKNSSKETDTVMGDTRGVSRDGNPDFDSDVDGLNSTPATDATQVNTDIFLHHFSVWNRAG